MSTLKGTHIYLLSRAGILNVNMLLAGTVNSVIDQLSAFTSEVTQVALEVGTQGILGGQARVEGVQGTWADLTRNVNVSLFPLSFDFNTYFSL